MSQADSRALGRVALLVADVTTTALSGAAGPGGDAGALVVATLAHGGPRRPGQLRTITGLTTSGVSNLLTRLQAGGLVRRVDGDGRDRRAVLVELTAHGRATAREANVALRRNVRAATTAVAELVALLEHLGAQRRPTPGQRQLPARLAVPQAVAALTVQLATAMTTALTDATGGLVLVAVADTGGCRPRYLTERLRRSSAGVAGTLDRLAGVGLVERRAAVDGDDQRATAVALTPAGAVSVSELIRQVDTARDDLFVAAQRLADTLG